MPCFFCGKRVSLVRQMSDADFCSEDHRKKYHALTRQAFGRLLEDTRRNAPPASGPELEAEPAVSPAPPPKEVHRRTPSERPSKRGHHEPAPAFTTSHPPKPAPIATPQPEPVTARTTAFRGVFVAPPASPEPLRAEAIREEPEPPALTFLPERPGDFAGTAAIAHLESDRSHEFVARSPQAPLTVVERRPRRVVVPRLPARPPILSQPPRPAMPAAPRPVGEAGGRSMPRVRLQRMSGAGVVLANIRPGGLLSLACTVRNRHFEVRLGTTGLLPFRNLVAPALESSLPRAHFGRAAAPINLSMPGAVRIRAGVREAFPIWFAAAVDIPFHRYSPIDGLVDDTPPCAEKWLTRYPHPLPRVFPYRACAAPELRGTPVLLSDAWQFLSPAERRPGCRTIEGSQSPAHEPHPTALGRQGRPQPAAAPPFDAGIAVPLCPDSDPPRLPAATAILSARVAAGAARGALQAEMIALRAQAPSIPTRKSNGSATAAPVRKNNVFGMQPWCENPLPAAHALAIRSLDAPPAPLPRRVFVPMAALTVDAECLLPTFEYKPLSVRAARRALPAPKLEAPPAATQASNAGEIARRAKLAVSAREALPCPQAVQPEFRAKAAEPGSPRGLSIAFAPQPAGMPGRTVAGWTVAHELEIGVPLVPQKQAPIGPRTRASAIVPTERGTLAPMEPVGPAFSNRLRDTQLLAVASQAADREFRRSAECRQTFPNREAGFASAHLTVGNEPRVAAAKVDFLPAPEPAVRLGNTVTVVSPSASGFPVPEVRNPQSATGTPHLSEAVALKARLPNRYEERLAPMPRGRFNPAVRLSNRPSRLPVFRTRVEKARMPVGAFTYFEIEDRYDERSTTPADGYTARPVTPFIPRTEAPAPLAKTLPEAEATPVLSEPHSGIPSAAPGCGDLPYDPELLFVNAGTQLSGLDFESMMETYEPRWRSALKTASGLFRGVMLVIPGVIVLSSMLVGCSARGSSLHETLQSRAAIHVEHNFSTGLDGWYGGRDWAKNWIREPGSGFVRAGQLALYRPSLPLTDYQFEFLGQIENDSIGWVYRAADLQNYYASELVVTRHGPSPSLALVRYQVVAGQATERVQIPLRFLMHNGRPYRILQDVSAQGFTTSIEGEVIDFWTDGRLRTGGVGFFGEKGDKPHLYWMKVTYNDDFWGKLCASIAPTK